MRGFRLQLVLAAICAAAPICSVKAQDSQWSGSIAAGIGVRPDYVGSKDLEPTPYIAGELAYGRYFMEVQGKEVALGVELTPSLSFGPLFDIENGRDDGVKSDRVGRLPEIDDAIQVGGFVRHAWRGLFDGRDQLTLEATYLRDVSDTYDGGIGSLGLFYGRKLGDRWSVGGGVRLTHVDGNYAGTYFGVLPAAAAASGLSAYDPGAGLRDVGVSAKLAYALDENWNIQLLGNYKQLLGDFKDSPVVKQEGRAGQFSGAVAVGYRF
ncbi:MipA/OmpV family protein [Niveispirillum sp.]|uniref:MipA/OmpV family protein n=1 Tax=Niveispirillum sp. TaxID=1917217 RepID=UPI001B47E81A|nr:MipA/OmpV family protein [Niveispirillum sp.]MBP7335230.1 MipA/OmpV family protein [Niveispirillum sp.]